MKKEDDNLTKFNDELKAKLPDNLFHELTERRDSASLVLDGLKNTFSSKEICTQTDQQRAWELTGLFFFNQNRFHEALSFFFGLYNAMLLAQEESRQYCKGMPLVWIAECYSRMNFPSLTKRFLMLTLCEDAIRGKGQVSPETTGIYFRLVWQYGLTDKELKQYSKKIFQAFERNPIDGCFPEWILQELDQEWMREFVSPNEALVYVANIRYIKHLLDKSKDNSGKDLERLADYVLSCMPGCKTIRRGKTKSTDYDIVCSMEGLEVDFRSEFGRYFICECKDWKAPADFTTMAKFCRVLDSIKSRFGILFSREGISGEGKSLNAEREQLKVFQDRGMVIVVVSRDDLDKLSKGENFINMLRKKYESIRLDLV